MLNEYILKTVIEKVDHAIIVADKEGNFLLWNDTAAKILNLVPDRMDQEVWKDFFTIKKLDGSLYNNDDLPLMKATRGIISHKERLYINNPLNEEGCYLDVDAFPVLDDENNIIAAVASFTDVTSKITIERMVDELIGMFDKMKALVESYTPPTKDASKPIYDRYQEA